MVMPNVSNSTCPICLEDFKKYRPPLIEPRCRQSICAVCLPKLTNCPICSASLSDRKSFAINHALIPETSDTRLVTIFARIHVPYINGGKTCTFPDLELSMSWNKFIEITSSKVEGSFDVRRGWKLEYMYPTNESLSDLKVRDCETFEFFPGSH
jgi:hypothetical protein